MPPKLPCVSDADFARYRNAVDEYYALVDRILGQWMRRAEEDGATLIVNSDHGFKWGEDRSCVRDSLNPSTAGFWHRLDGVFAAWGQRVERSPTRGDASVFDVAPTVSALLSLPLERRASGGVVKAAFPGLSPPPRRDLSAIPVRRLSAEPLSEKEASEYTKKLLALGYLSGGEPGKLAPSGGDRPGLTEGAWNNLGLYFSVNRDHNDFPAAEAAYKKALELRPDYHSPQFNLAMLDRRLGKDGPAIEWLFRSLQTGHADPTGTMLEWSGHYGSEGKKGLAAGNPRAGDPPVPAGGGARPAARDPPLPGQGLPRRRGRRGALRRRHPRPGHPERPGAPQYLPRAAQRGHRLFPAVARRKTRSTGSHSVPRSATKGPAFEPETALKGRGMKTRILGIALIVIAACVAPSSGAARQAAKPPRRPPASRRGCRDT